MRFHATPMALLAALPTLSIAVSLSDFTPRVSNLPSACDKVYHQTISGCQPSDFSGSSGCSTSCVNALTSFVANVKLACSSQQGTNIITAFASGIGPSQLCANAPSPSSSSSSSSSSASTTSSSSSSSATSSSSSLTTTSSSMTSSTTSSIATDTSSSPVQSSTTTTAPTQSSNADQGGSPFDVSGNAASPGTSVSMVATLLSFAVGVVFVVVR